MNKFKAHDLFCVRPDGGHASLHPDSDEDVAPIFCTALAELSGMLEGCETQGDLDEAVKHGLSLASIGTVSQDDLHAEVQTVLAEVVKWAESAGSN